MKKIFLCLFLLLPLAAAGSSPDSLVLSADSVELRWLASAKWIAVEGRGWWINSVEVDGFEFHTTAAERRDMAQGRPFSHNVDWLTVSTEPDGILLHAETNNHHSRHRRFCLEVRQGRQTATLTGTQGCMLAGGGVDLIVPSHREVTLPATGGQAEVRTLYEGWWVTGITTDGQRLRLDNAHGMPDRRGRLHIEHQWLTVDITPAPDGRGRAITLTAAPNDTGRPRTFALHLSSGETYTDISGTQAQGDPSRSPQSQNATTQSEAVDNHHY